ncbi:MAG: MerR family transcriptional regulator [Aristaeellaceae bacterium]
MLYTIGQVADMMGLPVSTLRYYDKEGLFPGLERTNGIRRFSERELEALRVIECLKRSGLEIRDIRAFMQWCAQGSDTYPQRLALFQRQKAAVEQEMERMSRVLDMLRFKCWYYGQAMQDGHEERLTAMTPEDMPPDIRRAWEHAHAPAGEEPPAL